MRCSFSCAVALVAILLLAGAVRAQAGDTKVEFVPEANAYLMPLPSDVWLVSRARVDLRDLDGEFYAQAEVFYDSRFGAWNRQLYKAGVEEEDQRSSTAHVDRVGLVLKTYW